MLARFCEAMKQTLYDDRDTPANRELLPILAKVQAVCERNLNTRRAACATSPSSNCADSA